METEAQDGNIQTFEEGEKFIQNNYTSVTQGTRRRTAEQINNKQQTTTIKQI